MDYSGAVAARRNGKRVTVTEGITYLIMKPIPAIPRTGTCAKTAGWASLCRHEPVVIRQEEPLRVRYLLHIHREAVNPRGGRLADLFNASPALPSSAKRKHRQFEVMREK